MKFKVGDKIKVRKGLIVGGDYGDWYFCSSMEQWKGKIMTIREVRSDSYKVEENNWEWSEEMLERAEYTYGDLKKSPIGTKVTFEKGVALIKIKENFYTNNFWNRSNEDLKDLYGGRYLGKIIKIEEPEYTTVYEAKVEILDEVEKRYLRGVIRPFRDKVKGIGKSIVSTYKSDKEQIIIDMKGHDIISLPSFEVNTMYKGMEIYKKYTLKELGL